MFIVVCFSNFDLGNDVVSAVTNINLQCLSQCTSCLQTQNAWIKMIDNQRLFNTYYVRTSNPFSRYRNLSKSSRFGNPIIVRKKVGSKFYKIPFIPKKSAV